MTTRPIVILGGGFAGLQAALRLDTTLGPELHSPIYLIDPSPYHFFTPSLFDLVRSPEGRVVAIPFQTILEGRHIHFIQERVTHIDLDLQHVITERRQLRYADLVIALGSQSHMVGKKIHDDQLCHTLDDLVRIRRRITTALSQKGGSLHVLVAGAGPSGVEFAAGLAHYLRSHGISPRRAGITLVEQGERILPRISAAQSARVAQALKALGVLVQCNTPLAPQSRSVPGETIVWTVGSRPHRLVSDLKGVRHDDRGRILVDATLQVIDQPHVWVAGDSASMIDSGTWQSAVAHGRHVAQAIIATRKGDIAPAYYAADRPFFIQTKPHAAFQFADGLYTDGVTAYANKRLADWSYFCSVLPWYKALNAWLSHGYGAIEQYACTVSS